MLMTANTIRETRYGIDQRVINWAARKDAAQYRRDAGLAPRRGDAAILANGGDEGEVSVAGRRPRKEHDMDIIPAVDSCPSCERPVQRYGATCDRCAASPDDLIPDDQLPPDVLAQREACRASAAAAARINAGHARPEDLSLGGSLSALEAQRRADAEHRAWRAAHWAGA